MHSENSASLQRSQKLYIIEAALEYLISILVTGSFLATLTRELGFSDSLTGILSSVISLGCLFQLLSIGLRQQKVKKTVVFLSVANQLLFMLLYLLPVTGLSSNAKIVLFVVFIFSAYVIYYFAHPKKTSWLMSLVEDRNRGIFTANKEIVSLAAGMVFSFLAGTVIDRFTAAGETNTAFLVSAGVMLLLIVLHTCCMAFTVEKQMPQEPRASLGKNFRDVLSNRNLMRVTLVFVIYYIASYSSIPFYGTYQINELGFSLQFVSVLTICSSIVRILVSKFWGRYADRKSFAAMISRCLMILALAFLCAAAAVPANGKVMFALYYIFHGISMGGINSALTNLVFDYAPYEKRADSLAVCQAVAGTVGFVTTLCISPLVTYIQSSGNTLFGMPVYAQQVATVIALAFTVLTIVYVRIVLLKQPKQPREQGNEIE